MIIKLIFSAEKCKSTIARLKGINQANTFNYLHLYLHICLYLYLYLCLCHLSEGVVGHGKSHPVMTQSEQATVS